MLVAFLLAASAPAIAGDWVTEDRSAIVRIAPCGPALCGRIARILTRGAPVNDIRNPDPARRGRPLVGLTVLSGFVPTTGDLGGQAYDPKTGRSYRSSLHLNANGTLRVTGCVAFICRSRVWTRPR